MSKRKGKPTPCVKCGHNISSFFFKQHQRVCDGRGPAGRRKNLAKSDWKQCQPGWRVAWNKGLTKETDVRVAKNGKAAGEGLKVYLDSLTVTERSEYFRRRIPKNTSHMGGLRPGSGRGKKGWYKGYWCDSSWELAWVIYQLDHGQRFTRNTKGFEYSFDEKIRKFYPDFLLENGIYVEIKGWLDGQNQAKIEQFPGELRVLGAKEIQPLVAYVEKRHGKLLTLYDTQHPVPRCVDCQKPVSTKRWKRCHPCAGKLSSPPKIKWPNMETLKKWIDETSYVAVGKKLGVTDNAIRKHLRIYGGDGRN
jgi:hypothetical protein